MLWNIQGWKYSYAYQSKAHCALEIGPHLINEHKVSFVYRANSGRYKNARSALNAYGRRRHAALGSVAYRRAHARSRSLHSRSSCDRYKCSGQQRARRNHCAAAPQSAGLSARLGSSGRLRCSCISFPAVRPAAPSLARFVRLPLRGAADHSRHCGRWRSLIPRQTREAQRPVRRTAAPFSTREDLCQCGRAGAHSDSGRPHCSLVSTRQCACTTAYWRV